MKLVYNNPILHKFCLYDYEGSKDFFLLYATDENINTNILEARVDMW